MTATPVRLVVHVAQQYRSPQPAEYVGPHPKRKGIVKVVYTDSRTAAWIRRARIVEQNLLPQDVTA